MVVLLFGTCTSGQGERYACVTEPAIRAVMKDGDLVLRRSGDGGIASTYNDFLREARAHPDCEAVVLLHDDVQILDPNFRSKVLAGVSEDGAGVIGAIGARGLRSAEWWTARHRVGRVHESRQHIEFEGVRGDVDVVDGLMLVLAPAAFSVLDFDERVAPQFHGYDVDYCLQARAAGLRVSVVPIDLLHRTKGGFGDKAAFDRTADSLAAKWPSFIRPTTQREQGQRKLSDLRRAPRRIAKLLVKRARIVKRARPSKAGQDPRSSPAKTQTRVGSGIADSLQHLSCPCCDTLYPATGMAALSRTILSCPECGTGRTLPSPISDAVGDEIWINTYGSSRLKRRSVWFAEARNRVGWLQLFAPEGCLLEVGTGTGEFLKTAQDEGYDVYGVEPSGWATQHARELGVPVVEGFLDDWVAKYPGLKPDVIAFWHVLEHVHDPVGFLTDVASLLRPGGIVLLEVPNFASSDAARLGVRWRGADPDEHVFQYTAKGITKILDKAGLDAELVLPMTARPYESGKSWRQQRNKALLAETPWPPLDLLRVVALLKSTD